MKKEKIYLLISGIILLSVLLAIVVISDAGDLGCCINPNADIADICVDNVDEQNDCCPKPDSSFPTYYSGSTGYGPPTFAECNTTYFDMDVACNAGSLTLNCTTNGCCCKSTPEITAQAKCFGIYTFLPGITDISQCNTQCSTPACDPGECASGSSDCTVSDCCGTALSGGCDILIGETTANCPQDCAIGSECNNPAYDPALTGIEFISYLKGQKQITLTWEELNNCEADYYTVYRCTSLGGSCNQLGLTTASQFTDSDDGLLWDKTYMYKVTGYYSTQSITDTVSNTTIIGNLECWGQTNTNSFCIHASYYDQYSDYITSNNVQADTDKYNKAYYCDGNNLLHNVSINGQIGCGTIGTCVVESSTPKCLLASECKNESGNPFGLYYTSYLCEQPNKYCFYDKSKTPVDSCYNCDTDMSCYDYKSEEACNKDHCDAGNCEWRNTLNELGLGVCVDLNKDNCAWCNQKGTTGMQNINAYNEIFDQCDKNKANNLSVPSYSCYYTDNLAKSCKDVVCTNYPQSDCPTSTVSHDQYNIISTTSDPCTIGVCQWFSYLINPENNGCYKNFDGDSAADCDMGDSNCEKDYFAPNTTLIPRIESGIYKSLSAQIYDKLRQGEQPAIRTSGYKTYLCQYNTTEESQAIVCGTNGHPYNNYTESTTILINNLGAYDGASGNEVFQFDEGFNNISYYSQDPSKNIGVIKKVAVETHWNNSGPEVFSVNVTGGTNINNIFYTNQPRPDITIKFLGNAIITYKKVRNSSGDEIQSTYTPATASNIVVFTPSINLDEGTYTFEFNARNENNIYMSDNYTMTFVIDNTQGTLKITPRLGAVLNASNVEIKLEFSKFANLTTVLLNDADIKVNFSSDYSPTFSKIMPLNDGTKTLNVTARDFAGNPIRNSTWFVVNALPENITMTQPPYGVSPTYTFNILITTTNSVDCRYFFSTSGAQPPSMPNGFRDLSSFTSQTGTTHTKTDFTISDTAEHEFYVACNDSLWGINTALFNISVDPTAPIIQVVNASDIIEYQDGVLNTTLYVQTDDKTICKYDDNEQTYADMDNYLPIYDVDRFRTTHKQSIAVPSENSYTYYVACENRAGLISATSSVTFTVDLTAPLVCTDNSNRYTSASTSTLSVETNKNTYCRWGTTQSTINQWLGTSQKTTAHNQQVSLASGTNTFYVICDTGSGTGSENCTQTITIISDSTPPYMIYASDNSTLEDVEYSWLTDRLRVSWLGDDNETGTIGGSRTLRYSYLLEEYYAPRDLILNWTPLTDEEDEFIWVDEDTNGNDLNLTDGSKYRFRVKAINIVDLWSSEMETNGITIDISLVPENCNNGIKDGDESDVDCGGSCILCDDGKICNKNADCDNGYCNSSNRCEAPGCDDGIENGDETDKDCGGDDCSKCDKDDACNENSDCKSSYCDHGKCNDINKCSDGKFSVGESDVDCGGVCPTKCPIGKYCDTEEDCIEGAKCISAVCTQCADNDLDCDGILDSDEEQDTDGDGLPDDWETNNGLDPNNPDDASLDNDGDGLTNTEEYNLKNKWTYSTNPNLIDTDGDGYTDKEEMDAGTNPLDADDHPESSFWLILLLVLGVIILLGGAGFIGYVYVYEPMKEKRITRPITAVSIRPFAGPAQGKFPIKPAVKKPAIGMGQLEKIRMRREEKIKKRQELFGAFGAKPEEKKEEIKKGAIEEKKPVIEEEKEKEIARFIDTSELKPEDIEKLKLMTKEELNKLFAGKNKEQIKKIIEDLSRLSEEVGKLKTTKKEDVFKKLMLLSKSRPEEKVFSDLSKITKAKPKKPSKELKTAEKKPEKEVFKKLSKLTKEEKTQLKETETPKKKSPKKAVKKK